MKSHNRIIFLGVVHTKPIIREIYLQLLIPHVGQFLTNLTQRRKVGMIVVIVLIFPGDFMPEYIHDMRMIQERLDSSMIQFSLCVA